MPAIVFLHVRPRRPPPAPGKKDVIPPRRMSPSSSSRPPTPPESRSSPPPLLLLSPIKSRYVEPLRGAPFRAEIKPRCIKPRSSRDQAGGDGRPDWPTFRDIGGISLSACCPSVRPALAENHVHVDAEDRSNTTSSRQVSVRVPELCPTRPHPCPPRWSSGRSQRLPRR